MDEKTYVLVQYARTLEGSVMHGFAVDKMIRTYSDKQRAEEDLALVRQMTAGPIGFDVIEVPHIEN